MAEPAPASETLRLVSLDHNPDVRALLRRPAKPHDHIVQFYEAEEALVDNVAHFVRAGLQAGEPVIIIATPDHREAFRARLAEEGVPVDAMVEAGQLVLADARATLATFMVGDEPSWDKFAGAIGAVITRAREGLPPDRGVRAYGEMVDVLWRDGNRHAALRLEELWNDLGHLHAFSLLCAYVMGNFYKASDAELFRSICRTHTHVIPIDPEILDPDARRRAIGELQQRARSLEHEVAHRRELEHALRASLARETALRETAEREVRFAEMFTGMLGHDLRNPLGTINMGATYLARAGLGDKPTRSATRIINASERMSRMIDQLLDFTRIRAVGGLELLRAPMDLSEICARVKDELEASQPQCAIEVVTRGDTRGIWDRDRLMQVISNLVGNAVSHGSASCAVTVSADGTDPSEVIASVHNAGVIDAEVLPVIFDPFRGGKKRHRAKGLGLGLFITRQIVVAHAGEIDVASTETAGTCIRVRLPRGPQSTTDAKVHV